jgi:CMP-N,N'-diacetyllegionaminic acid synthase
VKNTLCLIPAKGCSTRLPRKNILPLNGEPMIAHAIKKAINSKLFNTVCVSTEDNEIAEVSKKYGAEVPFMRPDELARDPSTIVDVMIHALNYYKNTGHEFEQITVLLPTAPFVTKKEIIDAHDAFNKSDAGALLSVTNTEFPPYNAWSIDNSKGGSSLTPCFPDSPYKHIKSTECPNTYRSNGAILIADTKKILKNQGYQVLNIMPYVMPIEHSLDIDTKYEYMIAKCLLESNYVEELKEDL